MSTFPAIATVTRSGPDPQELRDAARRRRRDLRALREVLDALHARVPRRDDERVARVRARGHGREDEALGVGRRDVLERVDREVDLAAPERVVQRAHEDARGVASRRRLALARELVALRPHDHDLDGPARSGA